MMLKPNMNYVMTIDDKYYYVGCHCLKEGINPFRIKSYSGNPLSNAMRKGIISGKEYYERVKVIKIIEFDTKEEAKANELKLIDQYIEEYGDRCINKRKGNSTFIRKRHKKGHLYLGDEVVKSKEEETGEEC